MNIFRLRRIQSDDFLVGVQNIFNLLGKQLDSEIIGRIFKTTFVFDFRTNFLFADLLSNPPDDTTVVPKAVDNAIVLYDSCIDEIGIESEGVDSVLSILENEFGGWPILMGSNWNPSNFNLTNLLIKLRQYDDGILYTVITFTNQENSSMYNIGVRYSMMIQHPRDNEKHLLDWPR